MQHLIAVRGNLELALNLVWLILSAGLIIIWRRQKISGNDCAVSAIALICLIAFLFPIISITDDLNGGALLAETAKQKRVLFAELAALVTAAFLVLAAALFNERYALLTNKRSRALQPFVVHLRRRPPPALT
jgi:hypothetical protein